MKHSSRIYIAGGQSGLVGTAIVRNLQIKGYSNIIVRSRSQLDLLNNVQVQKFFAKEKPEYVFLAAALVGGILANSTKKADFIFQNLQVQNNVISAAWNYKVKKLLFLGSSCIYPRNAKQPIKEDYLLSGPLESTNDAYAIAKIAGIKMCQSFNEQYGTTFISVIPTNLYGPHDNFDLTTSHVLPAFIAKFHQAKVQNKKTITLWGTGTPYREFLHVDDMAEACVFLMNTYTESTPINIGTGRDLHIRELAQLVKKIVGYKGKIVWDKTKPSGMPRKLLDVSKLKALGWSPTIPLGEGIAKEYANFTKTKT